MRQQDSPCFVNSRTPFLERDPWVWLPGMPRTRCPTHRNIKSIILCMLSRWLCPSPSCRSEPRNISWAKSTQHVKHLPTMHLAPSQAPSPGGYRNSSAYPGPPSNSAPTLKAIQAAGSLCRYYVNCGQWQTHWATEPRRKWSAITEYFSSPENNGIFY